MPLATEPEIIQAALRNDPEAWKRLVSDYGGRIYGIAMRFMRNEKEAEDAAQEVWILVAQRLKEFRGGSRLGTWLYRITVNKCLEKLRGSKREKTSTESIDELMPDFADDGHYKKEIADWSNAPDREADRNHLKKVIDDAVRSLPLEYREVIILRDIQGFSGEETTELLGLNESTMKTRLHRGRMALRRKLERKYGRKPWRLWFGLLTL